MASIEVLILRHYFELQGFLVRQCQPSTGARLESLHIVNTTAKVTTGAIPPILFSSNLVELPSALVWLPSWNAIKITSSLIKNPTELIRFVDKRLAERKTPAEPDTPSQAKIVVWPTIPTEEPYRSQTIALLKVRGIDAMISFRSVLQDLIARLDIRQPQEGLQLLQILSNFDLLKTSQMELFHTHEERKR